MSNRAKSQSGADSHHILGKVVSSTESDQQVQKIIDALPEAIYITDAEGTITQFNSAAAEFFDHSPELDNAQWCVSWKLFHPDGTPIPHEECPVTVALKEGQSLKDVAAIAERPDGERIWFEAHPFLLRDDEGNLIGGISILVDITERKQAEKKLRKREKRLERLRAESERQKRLYEAIINSTPDLVYIFDHNYRFIYVNEALLKMWGQSLEESIGKSLLEVGYEPWHAEMHEREIDQVIDTKQPVRGEVPFQHAELGQRIYDYIFVPIFNDKGDVESVAGTTRDITERKETEEQLRKSKEYFQLAIEVAHLGTWQYDRETDLVHMDERMCDIWDMNKNILPLPKVIERIHPLDRDQVTTAITAALDPSSDGSYDVDYRVVWDEGTIRWVSANGQVQFSGEEGNRKVDGFFGTALDITERKWVEERDQFLIRLNKALQPLHNPDDIMATTARMLGEYLEVDRCAYAEVEADEDSFIITGDYTRGDIESVVGQWRISDFGAELLRLMRENEIFVVDNVDDDERLTETNREIYEQTQIKATICVPLHKSGQLVAEMAVHQRTPRHWTPREIELVTTVTNSCWEAIERGRLTRDLQEMNETLEERVEKRTNSLLSYQDQLRSLASQLSKAEEQERHRLAAELHDNLGQMLAVNKMKMELLQKDHPDDELSSRLEEIKQGMESALVYTRNLMSDLKPPPSLDKEDVTASIEWLAEKMEKHDLEVSVEDDGQPKRATEEIRTTLLQCVRELLFNVIKHTRVDEAHISLSRADNQVQIIVEDNGEGFDPESQKSTSTKNGGFGLFNIRERIDLLGGSIEIDTKLGEGTKVKIIAPLKGGADTPTAPDNPSAERIPAVNKTSQKIKIMLVDDHQMMREGLKKIVDAEDDMMVIAEASNGEEAVELAQKTSPDIIVMDVNMPVMDGIDATEKITSDVVPGVRVIGLSLHSHQKVIDSMRQAGATAYLSKDEAFETLCATVRSEVTPEHES